MTVRAVETVRAASEHVEEIVTYLERMIARARNGEFEVLYATWVLPDGSWLNASKGRATTGLEVIGILATLQYDAIEAAAVKGA